MMIPDEGELLGHAPHSPAPEVGAVLEALRAEVRARRLARGVAEQGSYERELRRALDDLELQRVVSAHWPLTATSPLGRAVNLVHKLVRRYLRWYINPIVEQQNAYNDAAARALRLLADAYLDLAEQVAEARAHIEGASTPPGPPGEMRPPPSNRAHGQTDVQLGQTDAAHGQPGEPAPSPRFPDLELRECVAELRAHPPVSAHWPLGGTTLRERAVAIHNRLVRQYLRWYINPIVEQQNAANAALTGAIASMQRLDAQRRAQVAGLRAALRGGSEGRSPFEKR